MTLRLLALAASLAVLSGPALAADGAPDSSSGPVSTASQTTDQKISAWIGEKAPSTPKTTKPPRDRSDEPLRDPGDGGGDRKIHGEVGAAVGSGGYRSAYGVATIPIGKSSSATIAVSTSRGRVPWVAGAPWAVGPAGEGIRADCVCREAPDGSTICHVARAASPMDAQLAEAACDATR